MLRKMLFLSLTLCLSLCLLAPAAHARPEEEPDPSPEEVAELREQAEAGDAEAMAALGSFHENGRGVPLDDKEALAWYRKAAEQQHISGLQGVGRMYEEGRGGLARDLKEAEAWYARAAERLGEDPAENAFEDFTERRYAIEEAEAPLYRLRGGVTFKRREVNVAVDEPDASVSLSLGVDYPESGDPKALAALRKAVDEMIDRSEPAYYAKRYGTKKAANALKTARGGIQARLDALAGAFQSLSESKEMGGSWVGELSIDVLHQDKNTVTFRVLDCVGSAGTAPVDHFIVGKKDGQTVNRGELFVLPGTKPGDSADEEGEEEAERDDPADFAASALEGYMLGAWSGGLFQSEGRNELGIMGGSSVSWAEVAPYLTARGRELFAEHLPEKVKGAWCAEGACPDLPEFRRVEKSMSVTRGKGAKQTAAKVKTVVDWPEGGEPKTANALRKGVDALLEQCAAGKGTVEAWLLLRYRDPRLATWECMAKRREKHEDGSGESVRWATPAFATLSAADGRRIGFADLAEVAEEGWEQLMNSAETEENFYGETPEHPAPAQARVAVLYDRLMIRNPKAEDFPGWTVPYDDLLDARLTPAGKALLGR